MKNYRQIFLVFTLIIALSTTTAFASTSEVTVNNSINSTSSTTSTVSNNTHIRIETNGVVKECDSKNGDCSHMESDDGSSKVRINNNTVGTTIEPTTAEESVTPTPHASDSARTIISEQKKQLHEQEKTFLQEIEDFFKKLFSSLKLKF